MQEKADVEIERLSNSDFASRCS